MSTPFPYEKLAIGANFYGRDDEKEEICKYAKHSNNLVIYSKRRMGKSSLIKEAFNNSEYLFIYCDIFDITSAEDFGSILLKSLSNSIKGDIRTVAKMLGSMFKRAIPEFTVDPNTAKMSIKPSVKALDFDDMLQDFFNTIYKLSEKQKVVVAIDEFQQVSTISGIKIDAKLRKYMQESKNISYIFLGSKRHMLSRLFEHSAPLFEMASSMQLKPLKIDDVYDYTAKHLKIEREQVEYFYNRADGETKLMQHICHILYLSHKKKQITNEQIDDAIGEILNAKSSGYRVIFDSFSQYQKKAFKIISRYNKNIYSEEVLSEYKISKGTMRSSLKQLYKREIIDIDDDRMFIPDRALELWGKTLQ